MSIEIRKLAGILLTISGVTHILQLLVYPPHFHVIGAVIFGIIYLSIGFFILLKNRRIALWFGAILPTIGGILGLYRFFFLQPNPFTIFHILIDLIVVPICIYKLKIDRQKRM